MVTEGNGTFLMNIISNKLKEIEKGFEEFKNRREEALKIVRESEIELVKLQGEYRGLKEILSTQRSVEDATRKS